MTYLRPETPMEASRTGWQMKHEVGKVRRGKKGKGR
jgi:hypothetical protein